jgi:hypothetical protein
MDAKVTAEMARKHKDVVVGIKSAHYQGQEWVSVERAVEAGTIANIPVMVDFGYFLVERPFYRLVTEKLRPGDMAHVPGSRPLLDKNESLEVFGSSAAGGLMSGTAVAAVPMPACNRVLPIHIDRPPQYERMMHMATTMSKCWCWACPQRSLRESTISPGEHQHPTGTSVG